MPIELKEFAEFVGVEVNAETTLDTLKTAFNEKYVPVETHKTTLGEVNGKFNHSVTKAAKELGVELSKEEIKDKSTHELPLILAAKVAARFADFEGSKTATQAEIEEKFKGKLTAFEQKVKDLEALNSGTATAFEAFKIEVGQKEKSRVLNGAKDKVFGELKWSDTVEPLYVKGWVSDLHEKYQFEVDEDGTETVRDSKGNVIGSKAKAATKASFEEVIVSEFKLTGKEKVVDTKKVTTFVPNPITPQNGKTGFQVAPRHT
jgi:hypothetical protein